MLQVKNTYIAVKEESTPYTMIAPTNSDFILADADYTFEHGYEEVERNAINGSLDGLEKLRGMITGAVSLTVEMRGSGTRKTIPEIDPLLRACFSTATNPLSAADKTVQGNAALLEIDATPGDTTFTVLHAHGKQWFKSGDVLLVDISGDASGTYEQATIDSVTYDPLAPGDEVTLTAALSTTPTAGNAVQLINRVIVATTTAFTVEDVVKFDIDQTGLSPSYEYAEVSAVATSDTAGVGVVCTFTNATEKVNKAGHLLSNGDKIMFSDDGVGGALPAELNDYTVYYIVNKGTDDFEVSLTSGGAAVSFTDDGTGTNSYHVLSATDHELYLTPYLSAEPLHGNDVLGGLTYKLADSGQITLSVHIFLDCVGQDGIWYRFVGCRPNMSLVGVETGQIPKLKFDLDPTSWTVLHTGSSLTTLGLTPAPDETEPPLCLGCTVSLEQDRDALHTQMIEMDLGLSITKRKSMIPSSGFRSSAYTMRATTGTIDFDLDDDAQYLAWDARTAAPLLALFGQTDGKYIVLCVPHLKRTNVAPKDIDGIWGQDVAWEARKTSGLSPVVLGFF